MKKLTNKEKLIQSINNQDKIRTRILDTCYFIDKLERSLIDNTLPYNEYVNISCDGTCNKSDRVAIIQMIGIYKRYMVDGNDIFGLWNFCDKLTNKQMQDIVDKNNEVIQRIYDNLDNDVDHLQDRLIENNLYTDAPNNDFFYMESTQRAIVFDVYNLLDTINKEVA